MSYLITVIKKVIFFLRLWVIYFCAFGLRLGRILRLWATAFFASSANRRIFELVMEWIESLMNKMKST